MKIQSSMPIGQFCRVLDLLSKCTSSHLYVYDFVNDYYYITPQALKRFRLQSQSFYQVERVLKDVVYPEDWVALRMDLQRVRGLEKDFHDMTYRWIGVDGSPVWINCRGYVVVSDGELLCMMGCVEEIGRKPKADNISGLLGELALKEYLEQRGKTVPPGYVLRLGLDNFRSVNARFSVEYGDRLLHSVAECVRACMLPEQLLYRVSSDEFIVLSFAEGTEEEAQRIYRRIRDRVDALVAGRGYEIFVTISGGLLMCRDMSVCDFSSLMRLSSFTLNEAKRLGKNRCYEYCSEDYDRFLKRKRLERQLRQAVNRGFEGFEAHYQPIFQANGELHGAETLLRFRAKDQDMVMPGEFIPILEESGLIIPVGRWILHQAVRFCKRMQEYIQDFCINVNISYIQVEKSDVAKDITHAVKSCALKSHCVMVELTESGLLDKDLYLDRLWRILRENGIGLALDDFGTGYSNFHYLNKLRPDMIKIDRSFTSRAMSNEYEFNLLSLLQELAHNLKLKMCIEGIETQEELDKVKGLTAEYGQGFYLGRPCEENLFIERFVQQHTA